MTMQGWMKKGVGLGAVMLFAAAAPAQWSSWVSLGPRLSFRTAQSGSTCAITFRNNSTSQTLMGAKIHYIHSGKVDNDIMVEMRPQQEVGGWTAYSVEDECGNLRIEVYDQDWQ